MVKKIKEFKKGAASFYIVAFSTLILLILATSFAAIIISELERTSNSDLSQSAYDSAMAGVEDAKLAFYDYQKCAASAASGSSEAECANIKAYMESSDCNMVANILGRTVDSGGVMIEESSVAGNNMQQAYTCVKVQTVLKDYRATLSASNQIKVVKVKFKDIEAKQINRIKLSWYSDAGKTYRYNNFIDNKAVFPQLVSGLAAVPPTISLALVQTAATFNFDDFEKTELNKTDRGMIYLVPTDNEGSARMNRADIGYGAYKATGNDNSISASAFVDSNNKNAVNLPYAVYCPNGAANEFACSATIMLPEAIGGGRNDDTFMFVVGLPYGKPNTDFALEFFCRDGVACGKETVTNADGVTEEVATNQASLDSVQVKIDSTGRANDIYRRVETRLESAVDGAYLSLMGPLQLYGGGSSGGSKVLEKNYAVIKEWGL